MSTNTSVIKEDDTLLRLLTAILLVANGWLIYHLFTLHATLNGTNPASIVEFKYWRNMYYVGYASLFLLLGILRLRGNKKATPVISVVITHLILTTFSYAIVALVWDLLFMLQHVLKF